MERRQSDGSRVKLSNTIDFKCNDEACESKDAREKTYHYPSGK